MHGRYLKKGLSIIRRFSKRDGCTAVQISCIFQGSSHLNDMFGFYKGGMVHGSAQGKNPCTNSYRSFQKVFALQA